MGGCSFSLTIIFLSLIGMFLSLVYSLFLYNRIFFGFVNSQFIRYYCDCSRIEFYVLSIFFLLVGIGGFYPQC